MIGSAAAWRVRRREGRRPRPSRAATRRIPALHATARSFSTIPCAGSLCIAIARFASRLYRRGPADRCYHRRTGRQGRPSNRPWPPGRPDGLGRLSAAVAGRRAEDVLHAAGLSRRARRERAADPGSGRDRLGSRGPPLGRRDARASWRTSRGSNEHDPIGRVVVLEDTDGDGRMDKRTVFADGLVLARS